MSNDKNPISPSISDRSVLLELFELFDDEIPWLFALAEDMLFSI